MFRAICALVLMSVSDIAPAHAAEEWTLAHRGEGLTAGILNGWSFLGFVCVPAGIYGEYMVQLGAVDASMQKLDTLDIALTVDGRASHTKAYYTNYGNRTAYVFDGRVAFDLMVRLAKSKSPFKVGLADSSGKQLGPARNVTSFSVTGFREAVERLPSVCRVPL